MDNQAEQVRQFEAGHRLGTGASGTPVRAQRALRRGTDPVPSHCRDSNPSKPGEGRPTSECEVDEGRGGTAIPSALIPQRGRNPLQLMHHIRAGSQDKDSPRRLQANSFTQRPRAPPIEIAASPRVDSTAEVAVLAGPVAPSDLPRPGDQARPGRVRQRAAREPSDLIAQVSIPSHPGAGGSPTGFRNARSAFPSSQPS